MEKKQIFKKYYSKLALEGAIKASILGLIAGFGASLILAFIAFWVNYNGLWASIGVGFATTILATLLFYFTLFRPNTKQIAQRVDRLGLEERVITMMELEKNESYIALRQREDARRRLGMVTHKQMALSIFKIPVIILAVVTVLSVSMITVSALSVDGKLPWGPNAQVDPSPDDYITLTYEADAGGYVEGDEIQIVLKGADGFTVTAVADEGFAFDSWSDGRSTPTRTDRQVLRSITVYATFAKLVDTDPDEDDDSEPGDPNGNTGDPKKPGNPTPTEDPGGSNSESGGGGGSTDGGVGKYEEINQVIDGKTYYREDYSSYYDDAMKYLTDTDIPPHLRDIIEGYFKIIK